MTHGPPLGFGDRIQLNGVERHVGCADLLARVRQVKPRLHLFGHIHQDPGQWTAGPTRLADVTTNEGRAPLTVIERSSICEPAPVQKETFGAAVDSGAAE